MTDINRETGGIEISFRGVKKYYNGGGGCECGEERSVFGFPGSGFGDEEA